MKNVLIFMCDQLRKDSLGCYGNPYASTPNLDRLAQNSLRFTRNYAANPICMPNRLSLFTGMYPHNHGIWTNGLLIPESKDTLMAHLSRHGYQTASIGKIHFEPGGCSASAGSRESDEWWETDPKADDFHGPFWGFDYIELADGHHGPTGHMRRWFREKGGTDEMYRSVCHPQDSGTGYDPVPEELHSSAFVGERMCHYLSHIRDPKKPFFAVASFPDPHHPFISPKTALERWRGKPLQEPCGSPDDLNCRPERYRQMLNGEWSRSGLKKARYPGGISKELSQARLENTYAMVEMIDTQVGRILDTLHEQGLDKDTIIVFTSDHGELLGDYGLWTKGPFFFEGLISTPLLLSVPGRQAGTFDALFSAVDLAPTLCGLLSLPVPYYCDGLDLSGAVMAESQVHRDACLLEYRNGYESCDCNHKVLITQRYKYVHSQNGDRELTDLQEDPQEKRNLLYEDPQNPLGDHMMKLLLEEVLCTESKRPKQLSLA